MLCEIEKKDSQQGAAPNHLTRSESNFPDD
jgi:hypothetical protein